MASEDDSSWVKELEEALLDDCDLGTIREICQGRPVPEQLRAKTWQVCLRISSKGDALSGFDELFDMSEQQLLRDNCTSLVDKLGNDEEDRVSVTSDLESLLTFYCKSRSVMYKADNGWIDVLQPMLALKLSRSDLYNCFYALQQRFIPRECHKNGRPFHLFRLLLLYHDPELCSFLDSKRVLPDTYGLKWFNTLFSSICDLNVTLALWDVYLMTSDPFLLFFLPLVLLVNSKDAILEMDKSSKQEIVDYISALPSDIAADDIEDFFGLSQVYSKKTPQSFRRDYQQPLFGTHSSNGMGDVTSQVSQALCLPVSANELMMAKQNQEEDGVRYFVVDCRPADQYNNGHLNTAFHLDANLMLQNPEDFSVAVQALLNAQQQALDAGSSAGGRHLCFLGSGREQEDQYVHMVIANFLQKNTQFVCLIRNGYRALHDLLRDNLSLLSDHNPRLCLVCTPDASLSDTESNEDFISDQANSLMSKFSSVVKIKGAVMKEKISNYIKNEYGPDTERHVSNRDKVGKPYRSQTNMFSIDDDGDDDEFSESGSESDQRDVVNIETWLNKSDTKASFPCKHIVNNGYMCDSHLIVTDTHLFVLREISGRSGMAWIQARRALGSIVKITSKKRQPEVITFKYGSNDEQQGVEITDLDRFYIPRAGEATKTIKTYVIKVLDALGDS